jgi:hypothetical protein
VRYAKLTTALALALSVGGAHAGDAGPPVFQYKKLCDAAANAMNVIAGTETLIEPGKEVCIKAEEKKPCWDYSGALTARSTWPSQIRTPTMTRRD